MGTLTSPRARTVLEGSHSGATVNGTASATRGGSRSACRSRRYRSGTDAWRQHKGIDALTHAPPKMGKGKGKARAEDERMDVDVDGEVDADVGVVDMDGGNKVPSPPPRSSLAPPPRILRAPLPPPTSALSAGPSPSTSFARLSLMSPHPGAGALRPSWLSVGVGADVEALAHGDAADAHMRREEAERRSMPTVDEAVSAAVDVHAPADATGSSHSLDAGTLPAAAVEPSPRVRFVEPPGDAHVEPPEVHIVSAAYSDRTYQDDHQQEDALLMAVGEEEPYRPSPESPSPRQSRRRSSR
ncbi:hypothetical protein B0H13DRAFT_220579 [Mycena leptocephala]|nr:hypothetical protein B0H13DRAFT_220579 [Mycena leptocephala]